MISTILLIGAKSTDQPLESVPAELNRIKEQFKQSRLALQPEYEPYLTYTGLGDLLRSVTDQLGILHFAGHSDSTKLQTNDDIVYSRHIAGLLKTWITPPSLVFLNGCRNAGQVNELHEAGVKNVIATRKSIGDKNAASFAKAFYAELLNRPETTTIKQAFDRAGITAFMNKPGDPRSLHIEDITEEEADWDWGLYANTDSSDELSLSDMIDPKHTPPTIPRKVIATSADTILLNRPTELVSQEYDIFISYRTTRRPWVETLAYNLQQQGYKVFLDAWELKAGDHFVKEIFHALNHSKCALLIATPEAAESGWVQDEYEYMLDLANKKKDFFWIPIVFGVFPDFPFLSTIQALDFENSTEETYRSAFQKLLHGLERKPSGFEPYFPGNLRLPELEEPVNQESAIKHSRKFTDSVMDYLSASTPLMILAQADTNTQHYSYALEQALPLNFPQATFIKLFPPASTTADTSAYFGRLAKQCSFDETISNSWEWADALSEKIQQGNEIILLITGFENGSEEARGELAGELRGLLSNNPFSLKLIVMGGERLAAAKYELGKHSFFNDLEEMRLPDVGLQDLKDIYLQRYANTALDDQVLRDILRFTGKHPRLLEGCLHQLNRGETDWQNAINNSPLPSQLFTKFRDKEDTTRLLELLKRDTLGLQNAWPQDQLMRKLYWQNLLTTDNGQYIWRCKLIQKTGVGLLQC